MLRYFVGVESLEELTVVEEALSKLKGTSKLPQASVPSIDELLSKRIVVALTYRPLTSFEAALLTILRESKEDWVPYPKILEELESKGFASNTLGPNKEASIADHRAANALRLLSRRMKEKLHPRDIAGKTKAIEALASRAKIGTRFCYRLTPEGRTAVDEVLV
jgi:hypothetical protein